MLETIPGCNSVEKLRSILLIEADYNANKKELIGNRMMGVVQEYGLMMVEIFSEMGRTAEDGALSKILFYDIARQCRLSAAISSVDTANCYDSIAHSIASLISQACGGISRRSRSYALCNSRYEILPLYFVQPLAIPKTFEALQLTEV
jgi:hypothetical protein